MEKYPIQGKSTSLPRESAEMRGMPNVMSPFDGDIESVAGSLLDDFDDSPVENLLRK